MEGSLQSFSGVCTLWNENHKYMSIAESHCRSCLCKDDTPETDNDAVWQGSLSFKTTPIPSVSISYNNGTFLRAEKLNTMVQVSVFSVGNYCERIQYCSETVPCIGSSAGKYCDFKWGGDVGFCRNCPVDDNNIPNPLGCFFNVEDQGMVMDQLAVESCAATCASSLEFPNCKLCPEHVNGFGFGVDPGKEKCNFCPADDVQYPHRGFPLFGEGIKCWQVQKFFKSVEVSVNAPNCRLTQMMNYICGCDGPGYGGASTETKRVVLAWLPRAMAILSILVSAVARSLFATVVLSCKATLRTAGSYHYLIAISIYYRGRLLFFMIPWDQQKSEESCSISF